MTAWKRLAAVLPIVFAAAAGSAHAFGDCNVPTSDATHWKPVASMQAMLKGEGQKYLYPKGFAHQNQTDKGHMHTLLFVVNPDNKVGHIIEANTPPGSDATLMCDAQAMVHTEKTMPAELYAGATEAEAARQCRNIPVDPQACGFIGTDVKRLGSVGIHTIVHGQIAKNIGKNGQTEYIGVPNMMVNIMVNLSGDYNSAATNVAGRIEYIYLPGGAAVNVGDIGNFDVASNEKGQIVVAIVGAGEKSTGPK